MAKLHTADTHFNHTNLLFTIHYDGTESGFRHFNNVQDMNIEMIKRWDERVRPWDKDSKKYDEALDETSGRN